MNKAKLSRWCNPLEGVGTKEGGLRIWVLKLLERGSGVGAREARAGGRGPPSVYIYIYGVGNVPPHVTPPSTFFLIIFFIILYILIKIIIMLQMNIIEYFINRLHFKTHALKTNNEQK